MNGKVDTKTTRIMAKHAGRTALYGFLMDALDEIDRLREIIRQHEEDGHDA